MFHLDLTQLGKAAEIWYGDCGIRYMNVSDCMSGPHQPRITQLGASEPSPSVQVAYPGWMFTKGGVALVWVLDREMQATKKEQK